MAVKIRCEGITKRFGGVNALQDVSLEVRQGEIHAIVGENGAGKSTLVKIISGVYRPDAGKIYIDEKPVLFHSPADAESLGIAVIYQEPQLIPTFDTVANVFLGCEEHGKLGFLKWHSMKRQVERLMRELGADFDPALPVKELAPSARQIAAIVKALVKKGSILIMDEVTERLPKKEKEKIFGVTETLAARGVTIIYITHYLEEVFRLADRVTVLRDGIKIGTFNTKDVGPADLFTAITGKESSESVYEKEHRHQEGETLLEVRELSGGAISAASFQLHRGEILGITGLVGAGKTDLAHLLFGVIPRKGGELIYKGKTLEIRNPREAIKAGIFLVPEERLTQGLILEMGVKENISLSILHRVSSSIGLIKSTKETQIAKQIVRALDVKTPSIKQRVKFLSGGNQQKVVIGKGLVTEAELLILDEPTRGVDVGARREIQRLLRDLASRGVGIIYITSDVSEAIAVCDRILVVRNGRIQGEVDREHADLDRIVSLCYGKGEKLGKEEK